MAKQVRAARHYQRKDAPIRVIAQHGIPGIKRDLKGALEHFPQLLPPRERALELARSGNWHQLKDDMAWGHFRQILRKPFGRIINVRHAGAALGVQKINGAFAQARRKVRFRKNVEKAVGDQFNFDLYDEDTAALIREAQDELIAELEEGVRDSIDTIVMTGAREGLGPEEIVDDIRDLISLTDTQAQAVMNFQNMLYELDPQALQRQLRNTDYDAQVQDAIDSGTDLADTVVEAMTQDYLDNYLDYRAEMIAQTESTRAANAGLHDAYQQAVDRGAIPEEAVKRFWQVAMDELTCPICLSAADNNQDGVGVNELFDTIDGPEDDPPIHPNCRCSIEYVTDLDMVPDEGPDEEEGP